MIRAHDLTYAVGRRCVIEAIELEVRAGEMLAVLGPNGAGKTTLLRLLARELEPARGDIALNGKPLASLSSVDLARRRAVLPQTESLRFSFLVHQVVALGRYPWGGGTGAGESVIVADAMRAAGVHDLAHRHYTELSAGERARVQLARVLSQIWQSSDSDSRFLLLDEPTANLDLAHQHDVLCALRRFSMTGVGVVMVLHDLNLAQQYADRVLLLQAGRMAASGRPADVLNEETIRGVFDVDVDFLSGGSFKLPWIAARPRRPASAEGSP